VAIVTGGARGIGRAYCEALAAAGAAVVIADMLEAEGAETVAEIKAAGGSAAFVRADVADPALTEAMAAFAFSEFGGIDILVNNAGLTRDNLAMRMKDEEWDQVIAVNLTAAFRLSRACLREMMKRRFGRIIGITSIVGVTGNPGQANYAASKAGLIGMSKALAQEVASRGITVNCVAPGFIETAMTHDLTEAQKEKLMGNIPAGRMGTAGEIAAATLYLASEEAAYVTGQTLHVNGGMAMI